jgi:hypothetical protein
MLRRIPLCSDGRSTGDEAKKINWTVIGMKNDWKKIFSFE